MRSRSPGPKCSLPFATLFLVLIFLGACVGDAVDELSFPMDESTASVAQTRSKAMSKDGKYISWREHVIDAEDVNGGIAIRGGDGLALGDFDQDGFLDIISAQEDSNHLRIAYGTDLPNEWSLHTLADGSIVKAIEDVIAADLNRDSWPDIIAACEEGHVVYFQNPGTGDRNTTWRSVIPPFSKGRGSWLRVFASDFDGNGQTNIIAANKVGTDVVVDSSETTHNGIVAITKIDGPPLQADSWRAHTVFSGGVPHNAMPVDIDQDGDIDIVVGLRLRQQVVIIENLGFSSDGAITTRQIPIRITPAFEVGDSWKGLADGFHMEVADINRDGRLDLILNVFEMAGTTSTGAGLGWLEGPQKLDQGWQHHRIGHILPDWATGIHIADIDGDNDPDVVTGGYSGLNILTGTYSGAAREYDDPSVSSASSVGRLAWFENVDGFGTSWRRHDISRRVRGMYDMFASRDLDGDGDLDLITPRGNSGSYDGLVWLEQIRSEDPVMAFKPARQRESRHLPLPPENWLEQYDRRSVIIAPNKQSESGTESER